MALNKKMMTRGGVGDEVQKAQAISPPRPAFRAFRLDHCQWDALNKFGWH
jgi:hypothetical protein